MSEQEDEREPWYSYDGCLFALFDIFQGARDLLARFFVFWMLALLTFIVYVWIFARGGK